MSEPVNCVGIICFRGDDVLLIRRGKPPRQGEWSLPGGRIEPGETEQGAALRELMEETSISATLVEKLAVIDAKFDRLSYRLHDYLAIWETGEPIAGDDALEARFFKPADVASLNMWDKTHSIIEFARSRIPARKSL